MMTQLDHFHSSPNKRDVYGRTPAVAAIMEGDEKVFDILGMGADPNLYSTVSFHGRFDMDWAVRMLACQSLNLIAITPLHAAIIRGRTDFIDAAMSFGGNLSHPAIGASTSGNNEIFQMIDNFKRKHQGNAYIEIEPMDLTDSWLESIFPSYSDQIKFPQVSNIKEWIRFLILLCEDPSHSISHSGFITQISANKLNQRMGLSSEGNR